MLQVSSVEVAIAMYASAREELIERIRLRDQVLLAYLAAVGAIFAVAFGDKGNAQVLLALPFLAVGASVLVSQHNDVIGSISLYCTGELQVYLENVGAHAPQWDSSIASSRLGNQPFSRRYQGAYVILILTSFAAIAVAALDLWRRPELCLTFGCGAFDPTTAPLVAMVAVGLGVTFWSWNLLRLSKQWRESLASSGPPAGRGRRGVNKRRLASKNFRVEEPALRAKKTSW